MDVTALLVCAALVFVGVRAPRLAAADSAAEAKPATGWDALWRHRGVLLFCLLSFFFVAPLFGLEYAVPLLVTGVLIAAPFYIGMVYTINAATVVLVSMLVEKWLRRRNERLMMMVGGLLWTAGLGLLVVSFSLPALLLTTLVWTLGEIIISIVLPTYIANNVEERYRGRFMSLNGFLVSLARLTFPLGLGVIWQANGHLAALTVLLFVPITGLVLWTAFLARTIWHGRYHLPSGSRFYMPGPMPDSVAEKSG